MVFTLFSKQLFSICWDSASMSHFFILEKSFFSEVHFLSIAITFCIGLKFELYTLDAFHILSSHTNSDDLFTTPDSMPLIVLISFDELMLVISSNFAFHDSKLQESSLSSFLATKDKIQNFRRNQAENHDKIPYVLSPLALAHHFLVVFWPLYNLMWP